MGPRFRGGDYGCDFHSLGASMADVRMTGQEKFSHRLVSGQRRK